MRPTKQIILLAGALSSLFGCGGGGGASSVAPASATAAADQPPTWKIQEGSGTLWRAVHIGGNWGTNRQNGGIPPTAFLEYLRDLNVNWVGISIALHVQDSVDSTVESRLTGVDIPTFSDDAVRGAIRAFRQRGFHVYVTLAFEDADSRRASRPVQRWQLGDPNYPREDSSIDPANWPWALSHPDHARFVDEFFRTYSERASHYAAIAEQEGVELFSVGTETERLFRSRSGGPWPNDFGPELTSLVQSVRRVFRGRVTYDMYYGAVGPERSFYGPGSDNLWLDLGLDVVGVSAYFPLIESTTNTVTSVADLEPRWRQVIDRYITPLRNRSAGLPIVFLEFGYVDLPGAPSSPTAGEYSNRVFADVNGNGQDDGEETQANTYQAFFNVVEATGAVNGAFLWDTQMATDAQWRASFGNLRTISIRNKAAEGVVRTRYGLWR